MNDKDELSRRRFLKTVGASVPALKVVMSGTTAYCASDVDWSFLIKTGKFGPVDLSSYYCASSAEFGSRPLAKGLSGDCSRDGFIRMPAGKQNFRGIPFLLGKEDIHKKSWLALSTSLDSWTRSSLLIPFGKRLGFLCLAQFCDWDEGLEDYPGVPAPSPEKLGQVLAEVAFVYEDGEEKSFPIRRRFEANAPSTPWGFLSYASRPYLEDSPRKLTDPLERGTEWGGLQYGYWDNNYPEGPDGRPLPQLWICAIENPEPMKIVKCFRLKATDKDPLVICGITAFSGKENPLRYQRLSVYELALPESVAYNPDRWRLDVDLGVIVRIYRLPHFDSKKWLASDRKGLGEREKNDWDGNHLFIEMAASSEATLMLSDLATSKKYGFDLRQLASGGELDARPGGVGLRLLEPQKSSLHVQVLDSLTRQPTPVRISFRAPDGRYIPPYGHRREINTGLFQDYGGDVKILDSCFAYVDGSFQIELPAGEVFVEIVKGFEYEPIRQKLKVLPGQRDLQLEIRRAENFSEKGWITADVHVHFISPSTALLEGQAEGLNFVHLLAAQWGDLFSNVGDLSHKSLASHDGRTIVLMGTENRQHILGHIGLLGGKGSPVFPMSADGPEESPIGDPVWTSLADWADRCREREGLAVAVHFPKPLGEIAADIVLGKIDAVEMYPYSDDPFNTFRFQEWYKYLNCGYRLPAVGGTDKMQAAVPVGANRTYAYLGQDEFNMANWARAVRGGNTFMTTGPLLLFQVDGRVPGKEIALGKGGGTLDVLAEARSFAPFHRLEIIWNGCVVAAKEERLGVKIMVLKERIRVPGSGWLAARCSSRLNPTADQLAIAAHTSPVYVRVPGEELKSKSDLAYMLSLIEGAQVWIETLATRPELGQFLRIRKLFQDAHAHLNRRLQPLKAYKQDPPQR